MTQPTPSHNVSTTDLLLIVGQTTVELFVLRKQIADLQQRLNELEERPANGVTELVPESVKTP